MSKVLLAVDDSPASWKAVNHLADLVRKQKEVAVHIFHAIDPLPAGLQEFRGAENPDEEKILQAELRRKQEAWRQKAKSAAEPVIKKARLTLEQAGAVPEQITSQNSALIHREDLPEEILKAARETGCDTIFVGRNSFPWVEEFFTEHVGEEIQDKANRISISVID
jgi:nucleotide-binding universal stress UspA family protein